MKKLIVIILIVLISLISITPVSASAAVPSYGRALTSGVVLYRVPGTHYDYALFYIPYSYYVRVIDEDGVFYIVEYQDNLNGFNKLLGYVKKSDLDYTVEEPSSPVYPQFSLSILSSTYLYTRPDTTADKAATCFKDQTVRLYGKILSKDGETPFYYVRFGTEYGYIPASYCSLPPETLNPDPLPKEPEPEPEPEPENPSEEPGGGLKAKDVLQIVLIAAITLTALVIVYTMFKPKAKSKPNDSYYNEDEEEF